MTANGHLLEVSNLKTYIYLHEGVVRAVDGVSFTIQPGRTLGVIGESGSGKSVTAQSVMGIIPSPPAKVVDGSIKLHHEVSPGQVEEIDLLALPLNGQRMREIRWDEISMVFQEPMSSFSPLHTIGNQIMEAIMLHVPGSTKESARDRAVDFLRRVGIAQPSRLVDEYPHQLSGGMRQRAMIAMALSCNPRLLIADEPTTALDVTIEAQILQLIKDLQAEFGMAIMYISHDLAVVTDVSDEIMVMYLGLVMEHASTDEIVDNPQHPYTQALWRSIPRIDGDLSELVPISGAVPSPYTIHRGCPFFSRCQERIPGLCDVARPPLVEVTPGHTARCVLYLNDEQKAALKEQPKETA